MHFSIWHFDVVLLDRREQCELIFSTGKIGRLRELRYLNLALNNIEHIPLSLAKCEAITKLDLTANFLTNLIDMVLVLQGMFSLQVL